MSTCNSDNDNESCRPHFGGIGYCCRGQCIGIPLKLHDGMQRGCEPDESWNSTWPADNNGTSISTQTARDTSLCLHKSELCLPEGVQKCCSGLCEIRPGDSFGTCADNTGCLAEGATCTATGSLGICCSEFCLVFESQSVGKCEMVPTKSPPPASSPRETNNSNNGNLWLVYSSVTAGLVVLLIIGFVWLYKRQRKVEKKLSKREKELFFYGDPESAHLNGYAHEVVDQLPYNHDLEISNTAFTINKVKQLGSGAFGMVYKGKVHNKTVAVKTIRHTVDDGSGLKALLSEIKILQYIGMAENIVSMIGCNTSNIEDGEVYVFLEFCSLGSLESFLRKNKYNYASDIDNMDEAEYDNAPLLTESAITQSDLLIWSLQIANAMKYLVIKKVIHADLATRNVLLLRKDCVKVTDFGLSRRLYEYSNYVKKQQEPLPWRWMALESLQQLSFSHLSDIWSFGITFWEIYSLGNVPYPGLSWTSEFVSKLENNLRPTKPTVASPELYDIMIDCWKPIPETRPTFENIYSRLFKYQQKLSRK